MAEASLQKDEDLTCSICMDTYKRPKVLSCLHSFCTECLEGLLPQKPVTALDSSNPLSVESLPTEAESEDEDLLDVSEGSPTPLEPSLDLVDTDEPDQVTILPPTIHAFSLPNDFIAPKTSGEECFPATSKSLFIADSADISFQETVIKCPVCKAESKVPGGKIEELPDDSEILDRLEKYSVKQSLAKKELACILCFTEESVTEYCLDCPGALCEFCVKAHRRQKQYEDHSVIPYDKLNPEQVISPKKKRTCKNHNKAFIFFCEDCKELICSTCLVDRHTRHNYLELDSADESCVKEIQRLVQASEQTLKAFHSHKDYLQGIEKAVVTSNHTDQLIKKINNEFDAYIQTLQERRESLLAEAEKDGNCSKKFVWSEKEYVDRTITKIESGVRFAQRAQRCGSREERIGMTTQVMSRLAEVSRASWDRSAIPSPKVFRVSTQQPSINALSSLGELSLLSDDDITLEKEQEPSVCQQSLITVNFHVDPLSMPFFQILYGKSERILDTDGTVMYESDEEENGYNIEFVPRVAGDHVLEIWLAGVVIGRKTFTVEGKPRCGNSVQVGPDWSDKEVGIRIGKVKGTISMQRSVTVDWGDGIQHNYKWGDDGLYEIELVP